MKIVWVLLAVLILSPQLSMAREWKDCTDLGEECFSRQNRPEQAFIMYAPNSTKTIVMIHGLTDTPYTFKDMALYFNSIGYNVYVPLMAGHGTRVEDLFDTTAEEWIEDVQHAILLAQEETHANKVVLLGFSMGGAVAALVAATPVWKERISSLILQAPAFAIKNREGITLCLSGLAPVYEYFKPWANQGADPDPMVQYGSLPVSAVCELVRVEVEMISASSQIEVPVFMTITDYDTTINTSVALNRFKKMASKTKSLFYLRREVSNIKNSSFPVIQRAVPETVHSDLNFNNDIYRHKHNPVFNDMTQAMRDFLANIP